MTIIIIFVYCAIIALIILAMLSIYCFSGMSSERFGNLSNSLGLIETGVGRALESIHGTLKF